MTMCVLIRNAGSLAIAADNRAVYMQNGKVSHVVSNNIKKIIEWNGGYISGSGSADILENVKAFAAKNPITSIYQIIEYLEHYKARNIIDNYWLDTTHLTAIYLTDAGDRAVYINANTEEPRALDDSSVLIFVKDIDTENFKELIKAEFHENGFNIENVIEILRSLFKFVSERNETVSSTFDFAFQNYEMRGMIELK
ncbi:hypothetical protein [Acinetobacter oleivorans]|uniref:Uncharacterized protein n=1 Tax=Acinetobacter oleivorans (strain JCM 16667 / KCTC 23045 / DR1) TaxID=436717 RepID=A0AAN0P6U2_ACISD|nr:hypothetical protein [Acinetobacter oleivorans]ADI89909.1 hypothetical protein AOLE_05060 [Acinetobacter oleivorans DR1]ESK46384.1 hypothetical protein P254_00265 [Acinetobacter oleivorans CIP 110421]